MSKKDFIALADAIKDHNREESQYADDFNSKHLALLASFCQQQNPRFNRERWLAYIAGKCGPSGGSVKVEDGLGAMEAMRRQYIEDSKKPD